MAVPLLQVEQIIEDQNVYRVLDTKYIELSSYSITLSVKSNVVTIRIPLTYFLPIWQATKLDLLLVG